MQAGRLRRGHTDGRGRFLQWTFMGGRCARDIGHDLRGACFADRAIAIVDAALREGKIAAARAALRVELVEGKLLLLGRQMGEIDTGKFAGAIGMGQENLAGILKGLEAGVNRQTEQGTNFQFIENGIAQPFVFLDDAALRVQNKRRGQGGDATIVHAHFWRGDGYRIVDLGFGDDFLDDVGIIVIDDQADNLELIFVFLLQRNEIGYFGAAGSAPGSPKIEQDHFAAGASEAESFAVECGEMEIGSQIGVAHKANHIVTLLCAGCGGEAE